MPLMPLGLGQLQKYNPSECMLSLSFAGWNHQEPPIDSSSAWLCPRCVMWELTMLPSVHQSIRFQHETRLARMHRLHTHLAMGLGGASIWGPFRIRFDRFFRPSTCEDALSGGVIHRHPGGSAIVCIQKKFSVFLWPVHTADPQATLAASKIM